MKIEKIIISIILLTVCGCQAFASVDADDELNPVDVINDYLAAEENESAQHLSQQITDLLIPANFVGISGKPSNTFILPTNENSQKLWETTIAVADENDVQNTANLQQAIENIKSLKFEQSQSAQQAQPEQTETVQQSAAAPESEEIQDVPAELAAPAVIDNNNIAQNDGNSTADALAGIENRINEVETPYEMAEILFHAGRLNQAAAYYKQALKSGSYETRPQDKAWIIFQLGNCLKESNPAEAVKFYARLLSEYPDSTWTKMAVKYNELLNLQMKNKPYELIKQQADELQKAKTNE
jgi:tetratricopeptide (TPR) repeat protein